MISKYVNGILKITAMETNFSTALELIWLKSCWRPGLCPGATWGAYVAPPDPLVGFLALRTHRALRALRACNTHFFPEKYKKTEIPLLIHSTLTPVGTCGKSENICF